MSEWYRNYQNKIVESLGPDLGDQDDSTTFRGNLGETEIQGAMLPQSELTSTFLMGKDEDGEFAVDVNTAFLYYIVNGQIRTPSDTGKIDVYNEFKETQQLPTFALSCVNAKITNFTFTVTQTLMQKEPSQSATTTPPA